MGNLDLFMMFADPLTTENGEPFYMQDLSYVNEILNIKSSFQREEKELRMKVAVLTREEL
jgi:hypothetical protein